MKRKIVSVLLCSAMVMSMIAGCGAKEAKKPTESADGKKVLKVAALEGGYGADMWKEIEKAFEEVKPDVDVELTVDKKIEDVLTPAMQAGDYPDVVHCATGRPAGLTETLTKEKGLLALTDVMEMKVPGEEATVKEKIMPEFLDSLATQPYGDGVTYYAPMFYGPCGLFYNAGLLKEKGWSVPTTWDEMWALGDKAKAEGIALFTYPTTGYLQEFMFSVMTSVGGHDLFEKATTYEDGIWESPEMMKVFDIMAKLATYTEGTTVANANNENFTKNQQLILDNKAIFCPNGTWLPGEMKDAPRADGFEWGFAAIPSSDGKTKGFSTSFIEQMWIPEKAKNQDLAKEFVAFMYSDKAVDIFAKAGAAQPVSGISGKVNADSKMYYTLFDQGVTAVVGGFAATKPVEGANMADTLFGTMNSIVNGDKTVADWASAVEAVSDKYREAK